MTKQLPKKKTDACDGTTHLLMSKHMICKGLIKILVRPKTLEHYEIKITFIYINVHTV